MTRIFLTHAPDALANYYGERALAALRQHGEVHVNPTGAPLDGAALIEHAQGCSIVVSDRRTPAPAAFFDAAPALVAFVRCAVDIRNVDVAAASRQGVLVTHATPGFVASVTELAVGLLVSLARHIPDAVLDYRRGIDAAVRPGTQLQGSVLGIIGYGVIGVRLASVAKALGMSVLAAIPTSPSTRQAYARSRSRHCWASPTSWCAWQWPPRKRTA